MSDENGLWYSGNMRALGARVGGSTPPSPTKTCSRCKEVKFLDKFSVASSRKDGHSSYCYECKREYDREYWEKTNEVRNARKRVNDKKRRVQLRQWIREYLKNNPCVDCGESDPIVLQFDHLADKVSNVSDKVGHKLSIKSIENEIAKCEVRCANCHARKTAKDFNWYDEGF